MPTTPDKVRELLIEGRRLNSEKYVKHCRLHHRKTFFFFCERLCQEPARLPVSSSELNGHILGQLRARKVAFKKDFNPQGWFGQAWTDWADPNKNEQHFMDAYGEVLDRVGADPYSYQFTAEWEIMVRGVFHEFKAGA